MSERAISLAEQIQCATKELEKRQRLYPRWVREGKWNELKAAREIAAMEAIVRTLDSLREPTLPMSCDGDSAGP